MASPRKLMRKLSARPGKLPQLEGRLSTFLSKRTRLGTRVVLHQLGTVPQTPKEKAAYIRISAERKKWGDRPSSQKKLEDLRVKELVLRISTRYRKRMGGRDPTVYQILGAVALRYGLDSKMVDDVSRIMNTTHSFHHNEVFWEGGPAHIRMAIRRNIPARIEEVLFKQKRAISSRELADRIGENWNEKGRVTVAYINSAMQLLETMGLVKKMPSSSTESAMGMWAHRSHQNPSIDYVNSGFYLLERLVEGKERYVDLYKPHLSRGKDIGNPNEILQYTTIYSTLKLLKKAGLVKLTLTRVVNAEPGRGTKVNVFGEAELTPEGARLMKQYAEKKSLPEKLRRLLLGQREAKEKRKKK